MPFEPQNLNHVGTSHAAAQFALAELATGSFLQDTFPDLKAEVVGVVRKASVRYRNPGTTRLSAIVDFSDQEADQLYSRISTRKAAPATLAVTLVDDSENIIFQGTFEWFLSKITGDQ